MISFNPPTMTRPTVFGPYQSDSQQHGSGLGGYFPTQRDFGSQHQYSPPTPTRITIKVAVKPRTEDYLQT